MGYSSKCQYTLPRKSTLSGGSLEFMRVQGVLPWVLMSRELLYFGVIHCLGIVAHWSIFVHPEVSDHHLVQGCKVFMSLLFRETYSDSNISSKAAPINIIISRM